MADSYAPYSQLWFDTFLHSIDAQQTAREIGFLQRQLPLHSFPRVLDLCCGPGRHALRLAAIGYDVTGMDFDTTAIAAARAAESAATFVHDDVRNLRGYQGEWDAVLIMWASFGYFAPADNRRLLTDIRRNLRTGGRLVLDIYNRDFFNAHQGARRGTRSGVVFVENKTVDGDILSVELTYDGFDIVDRFTWQLFTASEIARTLHELGFAVLTTCAGFDEGHAVTPADARMQIVAERVEPR